MRIENKTSRSVWLEGHGRLVPGEPVTVADTPEVHALIEAGAVRETRATKQDRPEPQKAPEPDKEADR